MFHVRVGVNGVLNTKNKSRITLQYGQTYKSLRLVVLSLAWTLFSLFISLSIWLVKKIRKKIQPTFGQFCFADSIADLVVFNS